MKNQVATVLLLLTAIPSVLSAQSVWKLDKAHSKIDFSVTHMLVAEVDGRFTDFDGTVTSSKSDFRDAKIDVTIKTASITTDNDFRDKHLRSDDFFNAEKYPEIKFHSTSIEKTGDNTYKIAGDLTIRDTTKTVVLNAKYNGQVVAGGVTKAAFKATTTINRFDYGVHWNKTIETGGLVVGKDVDITLLLELNKQEPSKE
ncbi:MAG TPA: YceI family protein [Bacteroidota bacterium]|nr:YceI family protein [Bacteroidota bacterium]